MERKYPYPHHINKSEKCLEGNMLEHATLSMLKVLYLESDQKKEKV